MTRGLTDVLVVAGEPLWPPINGGRVRTAAIAERLARRFRVAVAMPATYGALWPEDVTIVPLTVEPVSRLANRFSIGPRLGATTLGRNAADVVTHAVRETHPAAILFAHSYLAAAAPSTGGAARIVDFPNVERDRHRSLRTVGRADQRLLAALETLKASWWEPRVARTAALAVAVDDHDRRRLESMGARSVVVARNAATTPEWREPSPPDGAVTYVGSAGYRPNDAGVSRLVRGIWPLVREQQPRPTLRIAGARVGEVYGWAAAAPGVELVDSPPDVAPILADAALVVAPVAHGGGSQLKVVEAVAHGRVVVATPYSARSIPVDARDACIVASDDASFANAIVRLLDRLEERHAREDQIRRTALSTWDAETAELLRRVSVIVETRSI